MSLKQRYRETIQPKLLKDLGLSNIHQVPKVEKINVNRGLGEAAQNAKALEASIAELATITGQKVIVTRAKKAIAGFKIRAGMPIGVAVTLRGERMYAFLERLIHLAQRRGPGGQDERPPRGGGALQQGMAGQVGRGDLERREIEGVQLVHRLVVERRRERAQPYLPGMLDQGPETSGGELVELVEGVPLGAGRVVRLDPVAGRRPGRQLGGGVALELDGVGAGPLGLVDQPQAEGDVAVVVHSRLGDHVAGVSTTDPAPGDLERGLHGVSPRRG